LRVWFVIAVVGGMLLLAVGLTIVQFRSVTPLAFRCVKCEREFRRPPHHDFPDACPGCGARDWAHPIARSKNAT
jgi:rRNA maturation endonuclease Nob1